MGELLQTLYPKIMHALDLISQGETPTKACDEAGITTGILKRHIIEDETLRDFADEAQQRGWDSMADVLLHIDTDTRYGSSDPKIMKVLSENIKWYLSKKNTWQYGDKLIVENKFTADKAIVEALSRGRQRVIEAARNVIVDDIAYTLIENSATPQDDADTDVNEFV